MRKRDTYSNKSYPETFFAQIVCIIGFSRYNDSRSPSVLSYLEDHNMELTNFNFTAILERAIIFRREDEAHALVAAITNGFRNWDSGEYVVYSRKVEAHQRPFDAPKVLRLLDDPQATEIEFAHKL